MSGPGGERWVEVTDDGGSAKPYLHPVRAPSGRVLSVAGTPFHPWHRGLWFTIKFVDGHNFWEEYDEFGIQRYVGPGRLEWVRADGSVALTEERSIGTVALGEDAYAIDWSTSLSSAGDTVLDRTPYVGWGGYGGLAFRGPADWANTRVLLAEEGEVNRPEGVPARWCDLSGPDTGVAILDHPGNPRFPVPWYGASRSEMYGEGWANFVNAAFLFHEPLTMAGSEPLRFRYRVIVHDDRWSADRVETAWRDWTA